MSIWDMFLAKGIDAPNSGKINGNGTFRGSAYMEGGWPPVNGTSNFERGPYFVKGGDVRFDAPGFGDAHMGQEVTVDLYCDGVVSPLGSTDPIDARIHPSVPDLPIPKPSDGLTSRAIADASQESTGNQQGALTAPVGKNDETRESGVSTGVPYPLAPPYTDKVYSTSSDPGYTRKYKVVDVDTAYENASSYTTSGTGTPKAGIDTFYIGKGADGNKLPSFGRPFDPSLGHSKDDFAWDAEADTGDGAGVLTVQGTVFIDAQHVVIKDVKFAGKGAIVTSGDVHIEGRWEPACFSVGTPHTSTTDPDGYPVMHVVGISAMGPIEQWSPFGRGLFYSAVSWTMNTNGGGSHDQFDGEVVAPVITMSQAASVTCTPGMGNAVPKGMPQSGKILAVSSWHEGVN